MQHDTGQTGLTYTLSMLAGGGLVLMILAAILGVIGTTTQGEGADTGVVALLFGLGTVAFIVGIIAWFFVVRPDTHFDDIDVALPDDHAHGGDDHADDPAHPDDHALAVAPQAAPTSAG
jgi:hypothetical protein